MYATGYKTLTIKLEMSEEEARWLKDYVQNQLLEKESPRDSEMRKNLFKAIKAAGVV